MPQFNLPSGPVEKQTITRIRDVHGTVVLEIGSTESTLFDNNGVQVIKTNDHICLVDGSNWSPVQLLMKPPVHVGVCELCRHRPYSFPFRANPTHGLVRLSRAKTCSQCGTLCCPSHQGLCADGKVRCVRCARRFRRRQLLVGLFFSQR